MNRNYVNMLSTIKAVFRAAIGMVSMIFLVACPSAIGLDRKGIEFRKQDPIQMSTVYKRYLEFPQPSGPVSVRTNPPVLRWPRETGKEVRYEVRLAPQADFSVRSEILGEFNTPWAMFNPHQKLQLGKWYWQYRKKGGAWSETLSFVVDDTAIPLVSPPPEAFLNALPLTHPRVLATHDEIPALRGQEPNNDRTEILKDAAFALTVALPRESEIVIQKGEDEEQDRKFKQQASKNMGDVAYGAVTALSEAYLLTGDKTYADKAIEIGLEVAGWDPMGLSGFSDFGDARCMVSMALVYDTFHGQLTERQQSVLLQGIKPRASGFCRAWTNNIEARLLSGHVWQHILHYFFQTGLALYDDDPEAAEWLAYAYEVFLARTPVLGGMDGGWVEGVSYFRMNMETLIDIPLYIKKFTGFDFMNTHPWYRHQVDWMIYHIPPGSAPDGFGDNTDEMDSPGADYVAFAIELAKLTGNAKAAWYARECQRYERNFSLSENKLLRWVRLAKTNDLTIPAIPDKLDLPMGAAFQDIGLVAMHTQPESTMGNLMVTMKSSPFGSYGHMLSDQNVFNILYGGEKLFYRTGYKVTMKDPHRTGWYQHTKSQNGLLVNGEGQPYSTEAFGWIARFMQGGGLAYAKGDASNAYRSKETQEDYGVLKNNRHLVLLQPDIVLIYDELEADEKVEWSWLIHSLEEMTMDENTGRFSVSREKVKGVGRIWANLPMEFTLRDTFDVPAVNWRGSRYEDGSLKTYDHTQWHLEGRNLEKSSRIRFLAIIQAGPNQPQPDLITEEASDGTIKLKIGNWHIEANMADTRDPGIYIQNQESGTVFSSHGQEIEMEGKVYQGTYPGHSLLVFEQAGIPTFHETMDIMPYEMERRRNNYLRPTEYPGFMKKTVRLAPSIENGITKY